MATGTGGANNQTTTEEFRALEYFTDRHEAVERFNQYVNRETAEPTFLFFYGIGGIGKSLLLRYLRKYCCRLLTGWEDLQDVRCASIRRAYDATAISLPSALLDFGMQPHGQDQPQDPELGLLKLRLELSGNQLRFPLFDFAYVWYLHKTKRLSRDRLASIFPSDELTMLGAIADAVSQHPFGTVATAVMNVFGKHFKDRALIYWKKRNLEAADVQRIQDLGEEQPDLIIDELPACFAADLNSSMRLPASPKRVVLFFDAHEAFWGQEKRGLGDLEYDRRDQWFRRLLGTLQPEKGIVVVIAAQEIPQWSKARKHPVPESKVECKLIGNLSEKNAQEYLQLANIDDATMRGVVCRLAEVEPGQVHPLFLGLCADIILEAAQSGVVLGPDEFAKSPRAADIGPALVARLIRHADLDTAYAVRALSACRAFDRDIYFELAGGVHFHGTEATFRKLTCFSFVSPAEGRPAESYRIHELLRKLIHDSNCDLERRANEILERYYRGLPGPAAKTEAIYHATRLDRKRGVREWVEVFDGALWSSDYSLCRALLGVRGALGITEHLESGMLSRCEADFLHCRALYSDSDREFKRARKLYEDARREADSLELQKHLALLLINYGGLQSDLSNFPEGIASYKEVLEICDKALETAKDDIELYVLKAEAHLGLGDANIWQANSKPAINSYSAGTAIYDQVLRRLKTVSSSGWIGGSLGGSIMGRSLNETIVYVLQGKAYGLGGLGDVKASLCQHKEAVVQYRKAESCYHEAPGIEMDSVVQNDLAFTLVSIAESEIELHQYEAALEKCKRAVGLFDQVVQRAPEDAIYQVNRSMALRISGVCLTRLASYEDAKQSYERALMACSEVLRQAPTDTWALCNEGLTFLRLGEMHSEKEEDAEALRKFRDGRNAFERLLEQTPNDDEGLASMGRLLFNEGEVLRKTARPDAVTKYRQSSASFDKALAHCAEDAEAERDKARTLQRLGELYLDMKKPEEALKVLLDALKAYDHYLKIAPRQKAAREARRRLKALLKGLGAAG